MTPENSPTAPASNVPELSVSELAFSLKRTLEETYGRVRVRGELGRITFPKSGHMYADLKDADACLNVICWKTALPKLSVKPEEGLEVICTGRVSSYPARSNYQLIIESMELAGAGALLKMLEERRKKLAAEGLFDPARKKKLPYLPEIIGVVTSPTGAVIRDIMHRLDDRFPRHVLLWPVAVQGAGAAEQIAAAIRGFDALPAGGRIRKPDLLIVARGGGSLEDLMAFNEEIVVRAVADCSIPVIAAVGHETDVTLIDHAADVRAPTPTGAAEMAVPVRLDLIAHMAESARRLTGGAARLLSDLRHKLAAEAARLGDPQKLLEMQSQKLDHAAHKLDSAFHRGLALKIAQAEKLGALLRRPQDRVREAAQNLKFAAEALHRTGEKLLYDKGLRLEQAGRLLESYSYHGVLARGFAVVLDESHKPVTDAKTARTGQGVQLEFRDGKRRAVIES
jgi:exodeoxyribonuclease VII large subunit